MGCCCAVEAVRLAAGLAVPPARRRACGDADLPPGLVHVIAAAHQLAPFGLARAVVEVDVVLDHVVADAGHRTADSAPDLALLRHVPPLADLRLEALDGLVHLKLVDVVVRAPRSRVLRP